MTIPTSEATECSKSFAYSIDLVILGGLVILIRLVVFYSDVYCFVILIRISYISEAICSASLSIVVVAFYFLKGFGKLFEASLLNSSIDERESPLVFSRTNSL